MDGLIQGLDHPRTRWVAASAGSLVMSTRARTWCRVSPTADGQFSHRYRGGVLVYGTPTSKRTFGSIEQDVFDVFCHEYTPTEGDTVLDIGAGIGEETLTFSKLVGERGRVIGVEAQPETFRRLALGCELSGVANATLFQLAVTDSANSLTTVGDVGGDGRYSDVQIGSGREEVRTITIDALVEQAGIDRIDLLKMNIEGAEQLAVLGMHKSLPLVRHAVVSCHDFLGALSGNDPAWVCTYAKVADFFSDAGFRVADRRASDPRPWVQYYVYASRP